MVLRLHRLVSGLQHRTPSSPEEDLSFSPKKSPILTVYYVLSLSPEFTMFNAGLFEETRSSVWLFARRKSAQSVKLAGEVLTPRWR